MANYIGLHETSYCQNTFFIVWYIVSSIDSSKALKRSDCLFWYSLWPYYSQVNNLCRQISYYSNFSFTSLSKRNSWICCSYIGNYWYISDISDFSFFVFFSDSFFYFSYDSISDYLDSSIKWYIDYTHSSRSYSYTSSSYPNYANMKVYLIWSANTYANSTFYYWNSNSHNWVSIYEGVSYYMDSFLNFDTVYQTDSKSSSVNRSSSNFNSIFQNSYSYREGTTDIGFFTRPTSFTTLSCLTLG